ncbi:NUDIX domain-containing protein [Flocculibacter collagenilyticus]|uniref:NUDIX domain-containing protein n=1 Tax=Flocculibacter collagenilyticus TaxID=2744479 RepID=UPI0018F2B083|nr:NUDIX domain-containing protein [Flocculibacter collagenilyticus]
MHSNNTLAATPNIYQGIQVLADKLPTDVAEFKLQLVASLLDWQQQQYKVVWLSVPQTLSSHIPVAIEQGFTFHHAKNEQLTLTKRLEAGSEVPNFATHTIGTGGVVISEDNQILTIVEQLHMATRPNLFKFPGGMLEPGEMIADGVRREVFEETGISTTFGGLIGFRHYHGGQFSTSNIYAVCRLYPTSFDIQIDETEIGKARWMPVEEYLAMDSVLDFNKQVVNSVLANEPLQHTEFDTSQIKNHSEYEFFLKK